MSTDEFAQLAALARLAPPDGEARTRTFAAARKVLGTYTLQVVETARTGEGRSPQDSSSEESPCPLRADEPRNGFPEETALELAPERGERLVQVPQVLGGGAA